MSVEEADAALARRAAGGDSDAFDRLVVRYHAALTQATRTFGVPATDVDDVVQDTFVAAWRALADYDPARPFRAWLFGIGVNKMRDHHRFRQVRRFLFGAIGLDSPEAAAIADTGPLPEDRAEAQGRLQQLVILMRRLEPELREALVLTTIGGLTLAEAADALGTTAKTVEGRATRARARLAQLAKPVSR